MQIYSKAGQFQYVLSDNDTKTRRKYKFKIYISNIRYILGYPVTCLKFYANKEDLKADHQKMVAATCM